MCNKFSFYQYNTWKGFNIKKHHGQLYPHVSFSSSHSEKGNILRVRLFFNVIIGLNSACVSAHRRIYIQTDSWVSLWGFNFVSGKLQSQSGRSFWYQARTWDLMPPPTSTTIAAMQARAAGGMTSRSGEFLLFLFLFSRWCFRIMLSVETPWRAPVCLKLC